MIVALITASLLASPAQSDGAWSRPEALRMIGTERHFDGPARPISIARQGGKTMFLTSGGLQGSLMGTERKEVNSAEGVFTWISIKPGYNLWLPSPSTGHYASLLQPVRFSPKDLTSNREAVEKALKGTIVRSVEAPWKGRDCYVLIVADKTAPSTHQEFWIDKETGVILKRRDWAGQTDHYELLIDRPNLKPEFTEFSFTTMENSVRIKGPVDPEILKFPDAPVVREAAKEIEEEGIRIGAPAWLRSIPTPSGFCYVHTVARKRAAARSAPLVGSALGAPEMMPGGLPPGWTVSGQVDPSNGAIDMRFTRPDGGGPRAIINGPKPGGDGSSFGITISGGDPSQDVSLSFVAYVAPDGTLVIAPGKSAREAEQARQAARRTIGAQGALIQSDFLDLKSGDTVSFMQSRNVDLKTRLRGFATVELPSVKTQGLGEVKLYEVQKPYPLRVIAWRSGDADYLLASSRLSAKELESIAIASKPIGRID